MLALTPSTVPFINNRTEDFFLNLNNSFTPFDKQYFNGQNDLLLICLDFTVFNKVAFNVAKIWKNLFPKKRIQTNLSLIGNQRNARFGACWDQQISIHFFVCKNSSSFFGTVCGLRMKFSVKRRKKTYLSFNCVVLAVFGQMCSHFYSIISVAIKEDVIYLFFWTLHNKFLYIFISVIF